MPKYTKLLSQQEYEKLTLDEKSEYILDMAVLLRPRIERQAPPDTNPPDDKPKVDTNPPDNNVKADLNPVDDMPKAP